jgi:hypothetical protein
MRCERVHTFIFHFPYAAPCIIIMKYKARHIICRLTLKRASERMCCVRENTMRNYVRLHIEWNPHETKPSHYLNDFKLVCTAHHTNITSLSTISSAEQPFITLIVCEADSTLRKPITISCCQINKFKYSIRKQFSNWLIFLQNAPEYYKQVC